MYFGWVTPASMILLWGGDRIASVRRARLLVDATLVLALLAYPLFLAFGYQPVPIGTIRLPMAAIGAACTMVVWYAFAATYFAATRSEPVDLRPATRTCWSAAVAFLVLSSVGAWALGPAAAIDGAGGLWYRASLHLFLDLFADGWLVLVVLGAAYERFGVQLRPGREAALARWGRGFLIGGLPLSFLFGVSPELLTPAWQFASRVGTALAGLGLLLQAGAFLSLRYSIRHPDGRRHEVRYWGFPLTMLALKAVAQAGAGVGLAEEMVRERGLRILYLHVLLLGGITPGLLAAAADRWGREHIRGIRWFHGSVGVLLLTLLPLTSLWPVEWTGPWILKSAAVGAALPVLAGTTLLVRSRSPDA